MNDVTPSDLIAYALGRATLEQARRVERRARDDEDTAWQLECLTAVSGLYGLGPKATKATRGPSRLRRLLTRRSAIAAGVALVVGGGAWAAYEALAPRPLMEDNFNGNWLDPNKWHTARPSTRAEHGYLRLNNRGSVVTTREFPGPVEIGFDWRWIELNGHISYRDTLTVAVHTSGRHAATHPYRVLDGLEVSIEAHAGHVGIASPTDPDFGEATPQGSLPMPDGKWHHVRILDDGASITIYLSGPEIDPKYDGKPVFTAKYEGTFAKHHIAIYNREPVAESIHESHIDNFYVKKLQAP
jgi:hypothetical protein